MYNKTKNKKTICMNKKLQQLGLFLSSFVPLYFLIICKIVIEILNGNFSLNVLNSIMLVVLIAMIVFGAVILFKTLKSSTKNATEKIYIVSKSNSTDQHFLGYFSLFVLFAISFEIEMMSMAFIFFIVLSFIAIVYIKNDLYYINPFLNILGYSFYDIKYHTDTSEKIKQARVFFNGKLELNKLYYVNFTNPNFCIVKNSITDKKMWNSKSFFKKVLIIVLF